MMMIMIIINIITRKQVQGCLHMIKTLCICLNILEQIPLTMCTCTCINNRNEIDIDKNKEIRTSALLK